MKQHTPANCKSARNQLTESSTEMARGHACNKSTIGTSRVHNYQLRRKHERKKAICKSAYSKESNQTKRNKRIRQERKKPRKRIVRMPTSVKKKAGK